MNYRNINLKRLWSCICLSAALSLVTSCGKGVKNSSQAETIIRSELTAGQTKLSSRFEEDALFSEVYKLEANALIYIPPYVERVSGSDKTFKSRIVFNEGHESEEVYCLYQNKVNTELSDFVGCYYDTGLDNNSSNDEFLNYSPGELIAHDKNSFIHFEIYSFEGNENIQIETVIDIDWH